MAVDQRRIYVGLFVLVAAFSACPVGPLGVGFVAAALPGRFGPALAIPLFLLAFGVAVLLSRRLASWVPAASAAVFAALCAVVSFYTVSTEYLVLTVVGYAIAAGVTFAWWLVSSLRLFDGDAPASLPSWGRTAGFLVCSGAFFWLLGCVLGAAGTCAFAIAAVAVLALASAPWLGVKGPFEGSIVYNRATFASYMTFGAGCSLYAGVALFAALDAPSMGLGVARWGMFALGTCASLMASVPVRRILARGKYGLTYGNISRWSTMLLPVTGVVCLILLTHDQVLGFFLLAIPPTTAMLFMINKMSEMARSSRGELLRVLKGFLGRAPFGAALGMVAVLLLWMIDDVDLRYQLVLLYLVTTCLYSLPSLPKRSSSAADLLKDELPENLTVSQRQSQAAAELAQRAGLTQREREVFCLLVTSIPLAQVADELGISTKTVQNHASNIYAKLGVHSLRDALRLLEE